MVSYTRKFLGDFPGTSLTVDFKSNLEVPKQFPRFPQKLPGRLSLTSPKGQPLSVRGLTPSDDSRQVPLIIRGS